MFPVAFSENPRPFFLTRGDGGAGDAGILLSSAAAAAAAERRFAVDRGGGGDGERLLNLGNECDNSGGKTNGI